MSISQCNRRTISNKIIIIIIIIKKLLLLLPKAITILHRDFNLSEKQLQQAFLLIHKVALERYTSELSVVEFFILTRSSTKLVLFRIKIVLFVKANQKL